MLFYASCLVHTALGIWALYERRQFSWKAIEPIQLVLGLSIPAMVVAHIIGVRLGQALYGHEKLYPQVFFAYWISTPYKAWLMTAVMIVSWVHGLHRPPFLAADEANSTRRRHRFCSPSPC